MSKKTNVLVLCKDGLILLLNIKQHNGMVPIKIVVMFVGSMNTCVDRHPQQ